MSRITERFFRYIKTDTQSDPNSSTTPSTVKQFDLAKTLKAELEEMGLSNVNLTEKCYLTASLNANISGDSIPSIGFIAHMDTAPDLSGANVKPKVTENYDGGDIILDAENNVVLSPKDFPELLNYVGQKIITTDGKTLLGGDDKAGITAIMEALKYLTDNPDIKHGNIRVAFTPDEEIGRGADYFNVEKFKADFAYTVDGGEIGELEYENFNAAGAKITIKGRNVHPGTAKNQMINSQHIALELNAFLPPQQRPEHTEGYEGFFHLIEMNGTVDETKMTYIIRDHDRELFEKKKITLTNIVFILNDKYGEGTVTLEMEDQYYNMREKIEPVMFIVDLAEQAMKEAGVEPIKKPIRGGTDGSRLSFMGLPCPNIFTGGHNFHGRYEYLPVESLIKAKEVIVNIAKLAVKQPDA